MDIALIQILRGEFMDNRYYVSILILMDIALILLTLLENYYLQVLFQSLF